MVEITPLQLPPTSRSREWKWKLFPSRPGRKWFSLDMRNSTEQKEKTDAFPFTFRGSLRRHFTSSLVPLHMILLEITWWWVCHRMKEKIWQIFSSSSFVLVALSHEFLKPAKTNEGFTGQGGIVAFDWCRVYVWQLSINKSVYFQSQDTRFKRTSRKF